MSESSLLPTRRDSVSRTSRFLLDGLAVAVRGAGGLIQFAVILILGRLFGAEVVGYYGFAFATLTLAGTVLSLGFPGYLVMQNSVRYNDREYGYFRGNITHAITMTALAALIAQVVLGGGMLIFWDWFRDHNVGYRILVATPTVGAIMGVVILITYNLRARRQPLLANLIERPILHVIALTAFLFLFNGIAKTDLRVLASASFGLAAAAALAWYLVFRGMPANNLTGGARTPRQRDHVSLPLLGSYLGSVIVDIILARSPLVVGSFFFAAAELGSFQIAFSFAASVIVLQEALGGVVGPRMAILADRGKVGPLLRHHRISQLILFLMVAPLLGLLFAFPDEIVLLVNRELGSAAMPLAILTVGTAVRCSSGVYRSIFEAIGAVKYALYTGMVAVAVLIAGIIIFADYGAIGLALAWTAATITHAVLGYGFCEYAIRVWVPRRANCG